MSKKSGCACNIDVSYLEETVYHVVLAGLRDQDLQERCTAQALLKNITNLSSLVAYWSADESGRTHHNATVNGFWGKSTYKNNGPRGARDKQADQSSGKEQNGPRAPGNQCPNCGKAPHNGLR